MRIHSLGREFSLKIVLIDCALRHWIWAGLIIFCVAAQVYPQLDRIPLRLDSAYALIDAALFRENSDSAPATMSTIPYHLDQLPLYFLLLNGWSKLAGISLFALRIMTLYGGLLSLAMVYRLTKDTVAPAAGFFAMSVMACNIFYGFYFIQLRFYTLAVLLSALALWLYLRMTCPRRSVSYRDYAALTIVCLALLETHAFALLLFATVGLYHLLAVQKDRRWLLVAVAAGLALLLAGPQYLRLLSEGISYTMSSVVRSETGLGAVYGAWVAVSSNGSPLLLAICVLGAVLGWRRGILRGNPFLVLMPLLIVSIGLLSLATSVVTLRRMRYFLFGYPIVTVFIASGLLALYQIRRWLGLIALLMFFVSGWSFLTNADWEYYDQFGVWKDSHPPWHQISRWMQRSGETLTTYTFGASHTGLRLYILHMNLLQQFFFDQYGITIIKADNIDFAQQLAQAAIDSPGYWIITQDRERAPATPAAVHAALSQHGYESCDTLDFSKDVVVTTYRWKSLHCDTQPKATFATDAGDYLHYGAHYEGGKLLFTSAWQPAITADPDTHNISFQLLDADWRNHGQIDLPTSSLSEMRQLIFELSDLPAGDYRLMVVVYDAQTGERQVWQANEDWIPEMQQLAEISISE